MSEENLPQEIGRGAIELFPGLTVEVVNLDNGTRVITEESMEAFMNWLQAGNTIDGIRSATHTATGDSGKIGKVG